MNFEQLQNSPQEMTVQTIRIVAGSARNLRGEHGSGDHYNRSLMLETWSQTDDHECSNSQKETDLKAEIKVVLSEAPVVRSAPLDPEHTQVDNNENGFFKANSVYCFHRSTQTCPQLINPVHSTSQISLVPAERSIIVEGDNNPIEPKPMELPLAEQPHTSNINGAAESGGLEIVLDGETNSETRTEIKTENNLMAPQQTTPCEHVNFIKKRWLAAIKTSNNDMEQQSPIQKHSISSNSAPTTPIGRNESQHSKTPAAIKKADFSSLLEADHYLENAMVSIGPNETRIPARVYHNMDWTSASHVTRKLLITIFGRKTLATHSMTGKPSPAFMGQGKPVKRCLDPRRIHDIVYVVTRHCNVTSRMVKQSITSKCADEAKSMRKRKKMLETNKENRFE